MKRVRGQFSQVAAIYTGGGGGGPPPWVPQAPSGDFAAVFADFVAGNYWDGTITDTSLFVQNSAWGNWDPANIVPGTGFVANAGTGYPVLDKTRAGVMSLLATGFTCVANLTVTNDGVNGNTAWFENDITSLPGEATDYYVIWQINIGGFGHSVSSINAVNGVDSPTINGPNYTTAGTSKIAYSLTQHEIAWAIAGTDYGNAALTQIPPVPFWTDIGIQWFDENAPPAPASTLNSIAWFPPQPNGDLVALST